MVTGRSWKFLLGCLFGGLLASCSNDFELTEGTVDLPVVYGTISVGDSATYIRVEKAFVDEQTSAVQLAKDPAMANENWDRHETHVHVCLPLNLLALLTPHTPFF